MWRNNLLEMNFLMGTMIVATLGNTSPAFACTRRPDHLFWAPIIDRVSGDCSFAGYQPNPPGILFVSVVTVIAAGFVIWRTRR